MITSHPVRATVLIDHNSLYGEIHEYYPDKGPTIAYALKYYDGVLRFVPGSTFSSTENQDARERVLEFLNR